MNKLAAGILVFCALAMMQPTFAQNPAEATGKVVDAEGNPVQGAILKFHAESNPALVYDGKTNKKGRFFVAGLSSGKQGDLWVIEVEHESLVPVRYTIENRTVNKVLLGNIMSKPLKPGAAFPKLPIRPLGKVKVDLVMAPPSEAMQMAVDENLIPATAQRAEPSKDPYVEALALAADGDLEGAVPKFEKALEKSPEDAERRSAYARVLYQLERWEDAAEQAGVAIEAEPTNVQHRLVLYSVYVNQDDLDGAEKVLEQARGIDESNVGVWKQTAYVASRKNDVDGQIAAYERLSELTPQDTTVWAALGDLYNQSGQPAKSETAYQKVVELDPDEAHTVFFNLGALKINADARTEDDVRKAIAAFRKAIEIKPDYAMAHKQLGFALLNVGDRSGARAELQNYVQLAGDAPDVASMQKIIQTLPE